MTYTNTCTVHVLTMYSDTYIVKHPITRPSKQVQPTCTCTCINFSRFISTRISYPEVDRSWSVEACLSQVVITSL